MLVGELRDMSYYYGCQLSGHATLGIAEKIFELLSHLTTKKGGTPRLYKRNLHAVPNSCGKTRATNYYLQVAISCHKIIRWFDETPTGRLLNTI